VRIGGSSFSDHSRSARRPLATGAKPYMKIPAFNLCYLLGQSEPSYAVRHLSPALPLPAHLFLVPEAQRHFNIGAQNCSYRPKTSWLQTDGEGVLCFMASIKHMGKDMVFRVGISQQSQQRRSGRQGCNPAGGSPAVSVARVGYVVMPHPGAGNQPGYAWCKCPGCPEDIVLQR